MVTPVESVPKSEAQQYASMSFISRISAVGLLEYRDTVYRFYCAAGEA